LDREDRDPQSENNIGSYLSTNNKAMDSLNINDKPDEQLNTAPLNSKRSIGKSSVKSNQSVNKQSLKLSNQKIEGHKKSDVNASQIKENKEISETVQKVDLNASMIKENKEQIDNLKESTTQVAKNAAMVAEDRDKIDSIKSGLDTLNALFKEKSDLIDQIQNEFKQFKRQQDDGLNSKEEIERKIGNMDAIFKNIESDFEKNKHTNEQLKNNLHTTDEILRDIKDEISHFESKAMRSNERTTKTIVKLKVGLDGLINELG